MEKEKCSYCEGLGRYSCTACDGAGSIKVNNLSFISWVGCAYPELKVCRYCNGTGIITCPRCKGTGKV